MHKKNRNMLYKNVKATYFTALVLFFLITKCYGQGSPVLTPLFSDNLVSSGWNQVVGFQYDSLGRMYVWEKSGKVWFVDANGVKSTTPVINLSDEVGNWRDHGLNGFALDPNFNTNGYIYLYYTVDYYALKNKGKLNYSTTTNEYLRATIVRVTRYTCDAANDFKTALISTRLVLIGKTIKDGIPLLHTSHSGGSLVFGDDGSLLISTGDGSSFNQVDTGNATSSYWSNGLLDSIIRPAENVGSFRSQMLDSYNGKILRVDPATGMGLPSNPFYDPNSPDGPQSKVWCLGLRNPFRFTVKRGSGSTDITAGQPGVLMIGEVGWQVWEEINVSKNGGENFGWPFYEGLTPHTGYFSSQVKNLDEPNTILDTVNCGLDFYRFRHLMIQDTLSNDSIFPHPCDANQQIPKSSHPFTHTRAAIDYRHNTVETRVPVFTNGTANTVKIDDPSSPIVGQQFSGNASVGGVYNSDIRLSAKYFNTYFHADYGEGWIKNLKLDGNNNIISIDTFAANLGPVVYLTLNPNNGCLTYVHYENEIRKICYTGVVNYPPLAKAQSDKIFGTSPLTVSFGDSLSYDPDGQPLSRTWYFGNGDSSNASNPSYIFTSANNNPITYTVILKVTDALGLTSFDTTRVYLNNTPPIVDIITLPDTFLYTVNNSTILNLRANVFDAQTPTTDLIYKWQTTLYHNNHNHPDPYETDKETTVDISPLGCDGEQYNYSISLTVCDAQGLCGKAEVYAYPDCNPVSTLSGGFTVSSKDVCRNTDIIFTDTTKNATSWKWYFPGGYPSQALTQSPLVNYSSTGTFPVYLVAKNDLTQDSVVRLNYIKVKSLPTITGITNYGNDTVCGPSSFYIRAITTTTNLIFQWYKNGVPIFAAFDDSLLVDSAAKYTVVVTNTNGCSSTFSKTIYNGSLVTLSIATSHTLYLCTSVDSALVSSVNNPAYTYQWYKNGIAINGANNSNYYVKSKGSYYLKVNANGICTNNLTSNTLTFTNRPDVTFSVSGPLTFCNYDSVILASTPCFDCAYKWYKNNTIISSYGTTKSNYKATTNGTYKVKVIDPLGCSLISPNWQVTVNPVFTVAQSGPLTFCNGDSVTLTVTSNPAFKYKWKRNNVWVPNAETNKLTIKTAGQYYCRVTDTLNNCVNRTVFYNIVINCREAGMFDLDNISLVPNPTEGISTLSFIANTNEQNAIISIYNLQGQEVWKENVFVQSGENGFDIDAGDLASGVYEIRISAGNEIYKAIKFVKMDKQ